MIDKNKAVSEMLRMLLGSELPGEELQMAAAPVFRKSEPDIARHADAVPSSVLILLYAKERVLHTAAILRAEYDGVHSGQVAFPGGRSEQEDTSRAYTALRESREEIGIDPRKVSILGELTELYIPRSNYIVYPFVGYTEDIPVFLPDPEEVQEVLELDLSSPACRTLVTEEIRFRNGFSIHAPGYRIGKHYLWGASAMIYSEFLEVLRRAEKLVFG